MHTRVEHHFVTCLRESSRNRHHDGRMKNTKVFKVSKKKGYQREIVKPIHHGLYFSCRPFLKKFLSFHQSVQAVRLWYLPELAKRVA